MNQPTAAPKNSRSLVVWNRPTKSDLALVCIPWAGAGAAPFRSWGPVFGDVATVYGVRLAGREGRRVEPPAATIAEIAAGVCAELAGLGVKRVALFGQCSGAVLAYELARTLTQGGRDIELTHLVVASQLPPPDFAKADADAAADAAEQNLIQYVPAQFREEPDLVQLLLPIIAADTDLVARYTYEPGIVLEVPLSVVYGAHDPQVTRAAIDAWRLETTGPTTFYEIAGGDHLIGGEAWLQLAETVRDALK